MNIREFQLERYLAQYEFSSPHLLCTSDCETFSIGDLLEFNPDYSEEFLNLRLGYTESKGSPSLREEIASFYGGDISPDQIVVTAGAEESIFISMNTLLKPGDHVIVQTPAYQSLKELPAALGCSVSSWNLKESGGRWHVNFDDLMSLILPSTKLIIINSPHNPTGFHFSKKEWDEIIRIGEEKGINILSDEVYRGMERDNSHLLPGMAERYNDGISIGVMSKAFGLAGLRIGWIVSQDNTFLNNFLSFKDYTTICSSAPSEYLSTIALRHRDIILKRNHKIIEKNLKILNTFFSCYNDIFSWTVPDAGSTAFPHLQNEMDINVFCDSVRESEGVLLLPGKVFDWNGSYFRIGYGRSDMNISLQKLEKFIEKMN